MQVWRMRAYRPENSLAAAKPLWFLKNPLSLVSGQVKRIIWLPTDWNVVETEYSSGCSRILPFDSECTVTYFVVDMMLARWWQFWKWQWLWQTAFWSYKEGSIDAHSWLNSRKTALITFDGFIKSFINLGVNAQKMRFWLCWWITPKTPQWPSLGGNPMRLKPRYHLHHGKNMEYLRPQQLQLGLRYFLLVKLHQLMTSCKKTLGKLLHSCWKLCNVSFPKWFDD